jgi:histidinol-phosphatase (PHP family)
VTSGSNAPEPDRVGQGFVDAAALAESVGFRPGRHPHHDIWTR